MTATLRKRGPGFTAVPNSFIRNDTLSCSARMLFVLLYSHSDNFKIRREQIAENLGFGRDKMTSVMNELKKAGYLTMIQPKDANGSVIPGPWDWELDLSPAQQIPPYGFPQGRAAAGAETRGSLEEQAKEEQKEDIILLGGRAKKPELKALEDALKSAAGNAVDWQNPGIAVLSTPVRWLMAANPFDLDLDILPTVAAICAAREGPPIKSWNYFNAAIAQARDQRLADNTEVGASHDTRNKPKYERSDALNHAVARALADVEPFDGGSVY